MMMLVVVGWQDGERSVKDPLAHWEINKTGKRQEKLRKLATATANSESNKTIFTVRQTECVHHVHSTCKWIDKKKTKKETYIVGENSDWDGWKKHLPLMALQLTKNNKRLKIYASGLRLAARSQCHSQYQSRIPFHTPSIMSSIRYGETAKRKLTTACASSWLCECGGCTDTRVLRAVFLYSIFALERRTRLVSLPQTIRELVRARRLNSRIHTLPAAFTSCLSLKHIHQMPRQVNTEIIEAWESACEESFTGKG